MTHGQPSGHRLAMFPLGTVLFPTGRLVLHVFEPRYQVLVERCLRGDRRFGVTLITRGSEVGGGDQRASVGTSAVIEDLRELPAGRSILAVRGLRRLRVVGWLPEDPHPVAEVVEARDHPVADRSGEGAAQAALEGATSALRRTTALLSELGVGAALPSIVALDDDPVVAGWQLCALAPLGPFDAQAVLQEDDFLGRLALLTELMEQQAADVVAELKTPPPP